MSVDFVNTLNYEHDSATLSFTSDEEIKNTNESIESFCDKLSDIICHHTFVKQLDNRPYSRHDIEKIIRVCNEQISETIDKFEISQETRDSISKRMLNRLYDLCSATLILNTIDEGFQNVTTRLAWERSLLNLDTKYLGTFLRGLQYIGNRIPDDGQSERLMLKYYDFLWQIRKSFEERYGVSILQNLEKFPLTIDQGLMSVFLGAKRSRHVNAARHIGAALVVEAQNRRHILSSCHFRDIQMAEAPHNLGLRPWYCLI